MSPETLRNPARKSGYDRVQVHPDPRRGKRFRAQVSKGPGFVGSVAVGPWREFAAEAASDYCRWAEGQGIFAPATPALRSAGHKAKPRRIKRDPEELHALGVLRDARAARQGVQGYVYLIVEVNSGGALHYGKIGFSTNPAKRVAELQTGNPRKLRLHLSKPGTEADEAALHQKYIKHNVLQEWFLITKELLLEWDASHQVPVAQSDGQSQKEAA